MTDEQLAAEGLRLRRAIPHDQALFAAIKREIKGRRVKATKLQGDSDGKPAVDE